MVFSYLSNKILHIWPPMQTLFGLVMQSSSHMGKEDCVTSPKNVCAGGYFVYGVL